MACWLPRVAEDGRLRADLEGMGQVSAEPGRRVVLGVMAAGSLALAGCKGVAALGPLPATAPDVVTLDSAIEAEERMVATYQSALSALTGSPADRTLAAAVLGEHEQHLRQLRARLVLPPRLAGKRPRPVSPAALPAGSAQVIAALAAAENAAAARLARQLVSVPSALAQLMASIGASEAAHAAVLGAKGRT